MSSITNIPNVDVVLESKNFGPKEEQICHFFGEKIKECYISMFPSIYEAAYGKPQNLLESIKSIKFTIRCIKTEAEISKDLIKPALGISAQADSIVKSKCKDIGFFDFKIFLEDKIAKFDEINIEKPYQGIKLFSVFHSAYTETINSQGVKKDLLCVNSENSNTAAIYRSRGYKLTQDSVKLLLDNGYDIDNYFKDCTIFRVIGSSIKMGRDLLGSSEAACSEVSTDSVISVDSDLKIEETKVLEKQILTKPRKLKDSIKFQKSFENIKIHNLFFKLYRKYQVVSNLSRPVILRLEDTKKDLGSNSKRSRKVKYPLESPLKVKKTPSLRNFNFSNSLK